MNGRGHWSCRQQSKEVIVCDENHKAVGTFFKITNIITLLKIETI